MYIEFELYVLTIKSKYLSFCVLSAFHIHSGDIMAKNVILMNQCYKDLCGVSN